ncbi:MAG: zinc ribbon domain-containing protein, partial [Anaeromyxobacteraceae bacterium]
LPAADVARFDPRRAAAYGTAMPIYEYLCEACGKVNEKLQKVNDPPPARCDECGSRKLAKLVSRSAFQLKGGGWYSDLYASKKKEAPTPEGASTPPAATPTAAATSTTPAKPEAGAAATTTPATPAKEAPAAPAPREGAAGKKRKKAG